MNRWVFLDLVDANPPEKYGSGVWLAKHRYIGGRSKENMKLGT